ncbi:NUDIX hydrolase [Alloscardovia venturai]|uniref:NUDIX hydrolase n=1 Tax=Alloscardovia venturai TaxID=1769421 RepID=A0ABW2Y583_9BIFI
MVITENSQTAGPPLEVLSQREVYHEQGGADFTVTEVQARVKATGEAVQFNVVDVKNGAVGAVCVAERTGSNSGSEGEDKDIASIASGCTDGTDRPRSLSHCQLLIGHHWRVATNEFAWEFPRGMGESLRPEEITMAGETSGVGEASETPAQTALREFREETGISVPESAVTVWQTIHADSGLLAGAIAVANIRVDESVLDSSKSMNVECSQSMLQSDWELGDSLRWVSVNDFESMIARGEITDGITLAAYTIWKLRRGAKS